MIDVIMEQIQKRAKLYHNGDMNKATEEYSRDHPEYWQEYVQEIAVNVGATVVRTDERGRAF